MAYFFVSLILALFSSHYSVLATRFLPTIVWDHLNPLLSCKCNWLVIPYVDLYDEQQFTCPTSKISSNLLDGYLRQDNERNENIFRRKWPGTRNDLINKIRNGSINSFCDPASPDTTVLHTCKNGLYDSTEVTYKYNSDPSKMYEVDNIYIFFNTTVLHTCKNGLYDSTEVTYKYNSDPSKMYEVDNIYIFFNNGDDGRASTLSSTEAKCTILFAVYVTDNKRAVYGMNFGKAALTGTKNCKLSSCPRSSITPSLFASPTTISSTPVITSTSTTTTSTSTTPILSGPQHTDVQPMSRRTMGSISPVKPATRKPNSPVPCADNWLNVTIFIVTIVGAFLAGMIFIVFVFALKKALNKRVTMAPESLTLENPHRYSGNGEACSSPPYGSPRQTEVRHKGQETKEENLFIRKL